MAEVERSEYYEEGRRAGTDLHNQAADCPYDHSLPDELPRRQQWMAGFADGRVIISDQHGGTEPPIAPRSQISPDLPVYITR